MAADGDVEGEIGGDVDGDDDEPLLSREDFGDTGGETIVDVVEETGTVSGGKEGVCETDVEGTSLEERSWRAELKGAGKCESV